MTHIATKPLALILICLFIFSALAVAIPQAKASVNFTFYGPLDEGNAIGGNIFTYEDGSQANCTVTIYLKDGSSTYGIVNYTTAYTASLPSVLDVLYFDFVVTDNTTTPAQTYHRQYWISDSDSAKTSYLIYMNKDQTQVSLNLFNYGNIPVLTAGSYLSAAMVAQGQYVIEKMKIDNLGTATFDVPLYGVYNYVLEASDGSEYTFGDIEAVSTAITLKVPNTAFSPESLLTYPYVTFYGQRYFDTPTGNIVILYDDTKEQTLNFTAYINDVDGNEVYSYTTVANSVTLNWTSAVNQTIYEVNVEVSHALYGDLTWSQVFPNEAGNSPALFSLSFLGDWAFDTSYLLPIFLVTCLVLLVSVLNAYVGAISACIAGAVMAYWGWLPIPIGLLVSAFSLAFLMALVYKKRGYSG